jgi:hypothetical protein
VVLLDTGAQPVILGVQFAKKMGMFNSKLRKSMWQIRTGSGSIKEVLRESSDLIAPSFNEGTNQELWLQVKCLVTNAAIYDVFIGQEALFPPGFTIDNWFEHAYYRVDGRWKQNHLVRCLPQGDRVVPPPHEWPSLIQKVHLELGHFGIKCTYNLFALHYH